MNYRLEDIRQIHRDSNRDIKSLPSNIGDDTVSEWLNPADPPAGHNKAHKDCYSGTGR